MNFLKEGECCIVEKMRLSEGYVVSEGGVKYCSDEACLSSILGKGSLVQGSSRGGRWADSQKTPEDNYP